MPDRSDENFFIALREALAAHEAVPDEALLAALHEAVAERDEEVLVRTITHVGRLPESGRGPGSSPRR